MSGYESPSPEDEIAGGGAATGGQTGSATGGGSPGNQDAMGADDGMTVAEGAGRPQSVESTDGADAEPESGSDDVLDGEEAGMTG